MFKKIMRIWKNKRGLSMVTALVMFALIFPFSMILPDLFLWGTGWYKAQSVVNEIAQSLGEQGGAFPTTVDTIQKRFADSGLNPSQWDLILTSGPLIKGDQGIIAVESTYKFKSVESFFEIEFPVYASVTYTSEVWVR